MTEAADPVAKENWVVIKIHTASMCTEGAKSGCATVGSPSFGLTHYRSYPFILANRINMNAVGSKPGGNSKPFMVDGKRVKTD